MLPLVYFVLRLLVFDVAQVQKQFNKTPNILSCQAQIFNIAFREVQFYKETAL